jgi:UDP-N-acetylmuramate--alanine ligase
VSGYDKTRTPLTIQLESEGISLHYDDDIKWVDKEADLVVYTPAIPKDHAGLNYCLSHHAKVVKRSDMLSYVTAGTYSICVAGTHGKTTTSSMVAHLLRDSDFGCSAFLGGITANYGTNFWSDTSNVTVAEADEYDRSFLKLHPDVAVLTAMDADHLDIYGTESAMQEAFVEFTHKIKKGGLLVLHEGLPREQDMNGSLKISYSLSSMKADAYAVNLRIENGACRFDVQLKNKKLSDFSLFMGGRHNVENAIAAIIVADHLKISEDKMRAALASFKGVHRRFEYVLHQQDSILIDDYAHHPEELKALISGVKEMFPEKKCAIVFQPHLYSRTKDFAQGFSEALSLADEVFLLPIYPARELPIEGVSSQMIADGMKTKSARLFEKEAFLEHVRSASLSLLVVAGAGDIDMMVEPLKKIMEGKLNKI